MLVKLHRVAPPRHRLLKGYVLSGPEEPAGLAAECRLLSEQSPAFAVPGFRFQFDERNPSQVWVDTGAVWLHSREARKNVGEALAAATSELTRLVGSKGASLLPNAVRTHHEMEWKRCVAADVHVIETDGDIEHQQLCNALREELPLLIAMTARSATEPSSVAAGGSKRLAVDNSLVAARPLPFFSEMHLDRIRTYYKDRMGVPRLEQLEVNPLEIFSDLGGAPSRGVGCRFIDGQMLVGSAMGHALLLQAIALKTRRRAKAAPFDHSETERYASDRAFMRARADAIAYGFSMQSRALPGLRRRRADQGEDAARGIGGYVLDLVEYLLDELRILEATVDELAPLLVGCTLRAKGLPALVVENDVVRAWARQSAGNADEGAVQRAIAVMRDPALLTADPITDLNRTLFPKDVESALELWAEQLRPRPPSRAQLDPESERRAKGAATPAEMPSVGPLVGLVKRLTESDAAAYGVVLTEQAATTKRRNWGDWTTQLSLADRKQLLDILGIEDAAAIEIGAEEGWRGSWATTVRTGLKQRGWMAAALNLIPASGHDADAVVRSFFSQAPGDVLTICLNFGPLPGSPSGIRANALFLQNEADTW